jgi:hypothetical protein
MFHCIIRFLVLYCLNKNIFYFTAKACIFMLRNMHNIDKN